jgi:hypothetical protein
MRPLPHRIVTAAFALMLGACHSAPPPSLAPVATSDSTPAAKPAAQFYHNLPYGTESQFNPFSLAPRVPLPRTGAKTATVLPNAGFFLDRIGSLLGSFITKGGSSNGAIFNMYPGVIGSGAWSPGVWVQACEAVATSLDRYDSQ